MEAHTSPDDTSDDETSPFFRLLWFCAAMFASSAICGSVPLFLKISPSKLRIITTIGVGLLVGTAFIVILPEGVHSVYAAAHKAHRAQRERKMIAEQQLVGLRSNTSGHTIGLHAHPNSNKQFVDHAWSEDDDDTYMQQDSSTAWIGAALAAGFVFMMLMDRLTSSHGHSSASSSAPPHAHGAHSVDDEHEDDESLDVFVSQATPREPPADTTRNVKVTSTSVAASPTASSLLARKSIAPPASPHPGSSPRIPSGRPLNVALWSWSSLTTFFSSSALIGIVIHSAVDGIAQGAISAAHNHTLETIVFFAIILHKGPAAFGLISFLIHQGKPVAVVRVQLILFALSAPISAIITYLFIVSGISDLFTGPPQLSPDAETTTGARLGLCLLFSGGTFLFTVAAHILPEIQRTSSWRSTFYVVIGIMFPLVLSSTQSHAH